ncbi:MAG: FHA domain-containing protein [Desulfuromonadales bacterium]|nr:FHA domain-containing protein [Desulfuromonadales bacterium]
MNNYQFPQQNVLCDEKPYTRELLRSLLDMVNTGSPPFTGYLKIAGIGSSLHFLFFFKGAPYAAGRYSHCKPIGYSIQEFGKHLASSADKDITVTLCETDPVLLKSMLLFLQTEPDVKAPTSLIDIEYIVQQIGEAGTNAMIALCRDKKINFFFFRDGKGALAYYSDMVFERPEGMTIDEEMQLYAFHQPGDVIQAFIFRDMVTPIAEDLNLYDKDSLYTLLTVGYLKNRRRGDTEIASVPAAESGETDIKAAQQKPKLPNVVLIVESGALQGERFTVKLPCTIGRKNCDLILDDRLISRRHAELKIDGNKLVIEDLESKNGTKVNGEKVTKKQLVPNDLISIGPTKLRVFSE